MYHIKGSVIRPLKIFVLIVLSAFLLMACQPEKKVSHDRINKQDKSDQMKKAFGYAWQANPEWLAVSVSQSQQLAIYMIAENKDKHYQKLEKMGRLSLTLLEGEGGGLEENIKRWARQLKIDEKNKPPLFFPLEHALKPAYQVRLLNKKTKRGLIGVVFQFEKEILFVKFEGSDLFLKEQEKSFFKFIHSITKQNI